MEKIIVSKDIQKALQDFCHSRLCLGCPFRIFLSEDDTFSICKLNYPEKWKGEIDKEFFVIAFNGMNKNGNSTYRVTGFRPLTYSNQYTTLGKEAMQHKIGGRWNSKTYSVITTQSLEQIEERINQINAIFTIVGE